MEKVIYFKYIKNIMVSFCLNNIAFKKTFTSLRILKFIFVELVAKITVESFLIVF